MYTSELEPNTGQLISFHIRRKSVVKFKIKEFSEDHRLKIVFVHNEAKGSKDITM